MEEIIDLIRRFKNGDGLAFEELCKRYKPLIDKLSRSFAKSFTDEDIYDDIHQDAVIAFNRAALSYDLSKTEINFSYYAKRCISNQLITKYSRKAKSKKRRKMREEIDTVQDSTLQEKVVIQELKKEFLSLAEDLLSNYEMKVFRLYISGLRAKEISARLGKSEKSVNNAIFRMRAKIRRKIKQDT